MKKKFLTELRAIVIIVTIVLTVKVTLVEAYIVPTGSMENTIMTGDFLVGSRFVYGMRTPDWIGIPYTDIGFSIPYIKFPKFKIPKKNDIFIFKYPRDRYVKYVKRCLAGPGDTIYVSEKEVFLNGELIKPEYKPKFITPVMPRTYRQPDLFLSSETNINKDNTGPIYIPKKGDIFPIHEKTNWRFLLPIILMDGHSASLVNGEVSYTFTLQDPHDISRRKGDNNIYEKYFPSGNLITPWSRHINDEHFKYLMINGEPASEMNEYQTTQNFYWAMGDNRDDSLDSRYWGYVPENFVLGEAVFCYFSINLNNWRPRWDRIGVILK
tara:strand:- start:2543 stop:3514 length:972 start_codon:yes stop_codon:yes gene_type:complete